MRKEAMKLAQKAIEAHNSGDWDAASELFDEALPALRKALANEALDRVSENARELGLDYGVEQDLRVFARIDAMRAKGLLKLTAALEQPAQQCNHCNGSGRMVRDQDINTDQECFVCEGRGAVEPEQPAQQQPVAYIEHHKGGDNLVWDNPGANSSPLYTSPAQRKPLTDEVTDRCIEAADTRWADAFVPIQWARHFKNAIEAAHGIKGDA